MPVYEVRTQARVYPAVVDRGALARASEYLPPKVGKIFVVTTPDVWDYHGDRLRQALGARPFEVLFFPGGEERKRMAEVEVLAEEMVRRGGDRSSLTVAFGGGIVGDLAGFLASVFMRGIPVIQVPTTLLAQVDAGVGGKTGVNLPCGKNLVGSFHQPLATLIDPELLDTLPPREFRAGLYEVIKCGVIRSRTLFERMEAQSAAILAQQPEALDPVIAESVRIKAEVVSADEKEGDLRRILNFGHTLGHALEAETGYSRFLHGEAVAFGMKAATWLALELGILERSEARRILTTIDLYGEIPALDDISAESLVARLGSDKKTVQGKVHFVLPVHIGEVRIVSGASPEAVLRAASKALRGAQA